VTAGAALAPVRDEAVSLFTVFAVDEAAETLAECGAGITGRPRLQIRRQPREAVRLPQTIRQLAPLRRGSLTPRGSQSRFAAWICCLLGRLGGAQRYGGTWSGPQVVGLFLNHCGGCPPVLEEVNPFIRRLLGPDCHNLQSMVVRRSAVCPTQKGNLSNQ
jgi:hypothetical protein